MTDEAALLRPDDHADRVPDRTAVVVPTTGQQISYRELADRSKQLADVLRGRGLRPGDHVAIFLTNRPEYLQVVWAARRGGYFYTAISSHPTPGEVRYLRIVVTAAAPISVEVKEQMIAWLGPILTEFYAGSEGNGFCLIDSATWLTHKGSVGRPLVGEVHFCSADGAELPPGETGTVWFSGTRRFSYHNDPAKTAGAYNDKGWSTLGDMGYLVVPRRPGHRPDLVRRGEHLPARGRGRARAPSGRGRHRRLRRP